MKQTYLKPEILTNPQGAAYRLVSARIAESCFTIKEPSPEAVGDIIALAKSLSSFSNLENSDEGAIIEPSLFITYYDDYDDKNDPIFWTIETAEGPLGTFEIFRDDHLTFSFLTSRGTYSRAMIPISHILSITIQPCEEFISKHGDLFTKLETFINFKNKIIMRPIVLNYLVSAQAIFDLKPIIIMSCPKIGPDYQETNLNIIRDSVKYIEQFLEAKFGTSVSPPTSELRRFLESEDFTPTLETIVKQIVQGKELISEIIKSQFEILGDHHMRTKSDPETLQEIDGILAKYNYIGAKYTFIECYKGNAIWLITAIDGRDSGIPISNEDTYKLKSDLEDIETLSDNLGSVSILKADETLIATLEVSI